MELCFQLVWEASEGDHLPGCLLCSCWVPEEALDACGWHREEVEFVMGWGTCWTANCAGQRFCRQRSDEAPMSQPFPETMCQFFGDSKHWHQEPFSSNSCTISCGCDVIASYSVVWTLCGSTQHGSMERQPGKDQRPNHFLARCAHDHAYHLANDWISSLCPEGRLTNRPMLCANLLENLAQWFSFFSSGHRCLTCFPFVHYNAVRIIAASDISLNTHDKW